MEQERSHLVSSPTTTVTKGINRRGEILRDAGWEVGETIVPMRRKPKDGWDNKTHSEGRVSTSTKFSEEVSDGACRKANSTTRQITRTPAQTILESQETDLKRLDLIWQVTEKVETMNVLNTPRRRLSESRMRENLMSGSMWQGMETRTKIPGAIPWPYHLTLGSLNESQSVFYTSAFFQVDGVPPPAHTLVTPTVSHPSPKQCQFYATLALGNPQWLFRVAFKSEMLFAMPLYSMSKIG